MPETRQTPLRADCRVSGFSTDGSASCGRSAHPRKHECSAPDSRLTPPSSETGGPGRLFFVGRRDLPSAMLRTRHVSLFAPSPSKPLARIPGRRTVPPRGQNRPVGRSGNPRSKDKPTISERGSVMIRDTDGDHFPQWSCIGILPLSPLSTLPRFTRRP